MGIGFGSVVDRHSRRWREDSAACRAAAAEECALSDGASSIEVAYTSLLARVNLAAGNNASKLFVIRSIDLVTGRFT
jgi:hypothetical protein